MPASPCAPASSHSTSLFTWSGDVPSPSPSTTLYALSAAAATIRLTPLPRSQALHLPASAESIAVVISGGAPHSWKIFSSGDALVFGTHYACQPGNAASADVPCSSGDAVAVLPLPVGLGRSVPIFLHVSVEVDYGNSAGLADFGVADDDEEDYGDGESAGLAAADGHPDHAAARRDVQSATDAALQFERVGKGPASALQVRPVTVFLSIIDYICFVNASPS